MKRIYLRDTIIVALLPFLSLKRKISVRAKTFTFFLFTFLIAWSAQAQNPIANENALPGNPKSEWDVSNSGDPTIQGFATEMSVNKGSTVRFKINVTGSNRNYSINIYRLGYYQGNGARLVASLGSFSGVVQPNPIVDGTLGLTDCSNWSQSASWAVPSTAVSGIYIAKLIRSDNGGSSHITFVVRDDAANSTVLFKTADATWQAYNSYGGSSFYFGTTANPEGRASKVSYNRPFNTRSIKAECFLFNAEYPMLRWLERNGYDMSYTTDVDMERNTTLITPSKHKVLLSVGHDEYWSAGQRNSFENARNAGVHLSFFSGNEVYWKVRWEDNTRTLVCYKEGTGSQGEFTCGGNCDPLAGVWTGLWRFGCEYGEDGCQPENALTGQLSWTESNAAIQVPYEFRNLSFWRNTSIATLSPGQTATLTASTLGYEWNYEQPAFASFNPPGRITLSSTTVADKTHKLSLYTHNSGAIVFGAGTVQWSWGLDDNHDREQPAVSRDMQQATLNLFLDMGVAPGTPQSNLIISGNSGDLTPPVSIITSPTNGSNATMNTPVTINGTASDNVGISRIEISTDGGSSWQSANGTSNWSYIWTPLTVGTITLKSRAIDVSGNIESQGTAPSSNAINVTVANGSGNNCPCTIFTNQLPEIANQRDNTIGIVLGTRFRSSIDGSITALRFYKGVGNTGTHIGQLWSSTGTLLAQATFTNETTSGWQQVSLASPVAITAGVTYIVSYYSSDGYYSVSENFFANTVTNGPLTAPADANGANNGLYIYSSAPGFPNLTYNKQNYFVDAVLSTATATDETPPTVLSTNPLANDTDVPTNTSVTAVFSESLDASFVNGTNVFLRNGANAVSATVSYSAGSQNVVLTPSAPLAGGTLYTVTLKGGTNGLRDIAGNTLVTDYTWNFTTATAPAATPPTVVSTTPAANATNVDTRTTITAVFNEPLLPSSVTGTNVYLRYGTTSVSATVTYTAGSSNVVLRPSSALVANRLYTVTLRGGSTGIKDIEGNPMVSNYSFNFTVTPIARRGSATTARTTSTTLTISRPSGIVQNDMLIVNIASRGNNIAPSSSGWTLLRSSALGGSTIRFGSVLYKIAGASEPTSYRFALGAGSTGGAGAIVAFSGVDPTNPFDVAPETITSGSTTSVSASAITTVTPNAALLFMGQAAGTNGGASITWSNSAYRTATSPGALTEIYDNQQTTIRASVGAAWAYKTTIGSTGSGSATITTAVANGGLLVALRPKSQSTTDNIPPSVMSTTPVSNATGVAINTSITTVVSESLLESSVNTASVFLRAGTTSVPASVSYTAGSTNIVLTPSSPLNGGTVYTVTLKGGTATDRIRDLAGNALVADYTWNFTTASTTPAPDVTAPVSIITSPATGASVSVNQPVSITGTANDAGGLNRVEISLDGGTTWQNATGTSSWSFSWTPTVTGIYTVKSRGIDNTGNTETAGSGPAANVITVSVSAVIANPCPCNIFSGTQPVQPTASIFKNDGSALALGVKFSTSSNGYITGLRFYKAIGNTGTHIGQLYTLSGTLLAEATFTNETASGWQQVNLTNPVAVTAGTVYIVSYHSSAGNYSTTNNYFTTALVNGPLRGLADGENGGNGLYRYNPTPAVPNGTYLASNYWVDVEFNTVIQAVSGISAQESSILDARFGITQNLNQNALNNKLSYALTQNAPNPSTGRTIIRYVVPVKTHVYLGLYDMQGRQVRIMVNEMKAAGEQQFELDTRTLGKGVYYYKMKAEGFIGTKRLVVE